MKKIFLINLIFFIFLSCSSSPKRIMFVSDNATQAYTYLERANNSIVRGDFGKASIALSDAYKLALSIDNCELLCKISFSSIVFKIACPYINEIIVSSSLENSNALLFQTNEEILKQARKLAGRCENKDFYLSICDIYGVRINLEKEKKDSSDGQISVQKMNEFIQSLVKSKKTVSKDPYYLAYLYRTLGDVCISARDYDSAVTNFLEAANIHTKNRYLYEIGLDWYCVARSYSLNAKKENAISAILMALKYDKDAENTNGIAADYLAYSKILLKDNPTDEEIKLSEELALWAEKIRTAGE